MAEQLRMPPFFPLSPAACKAETEAFFTAFSAQAAFSGESKVRTLLLALASGCVLRRDTLHAVQIL
jgi:hypothetical protein